MPVIKSELEQWKRRCLTPIGRINIVKALLLSKLVHIFIALLNPSTHCIKELEKMLFSFVWGQKNDKVKRSKLVQHPKKDGLSMIQIEFFIQSMKLSWLKRLFTSKADWTVLATQELPNIQAITAYGCKKLKIIRKELSNPFYVDIINALIQFNHGYNPSVEDILTEHIWFSDRTKYETTIVRKWDDRGLRFIGDLFNAESGRIYTRQDIKTVYGIKMTFLCYASLVRSLPQNIQKHVNKTFIKVPNIPYKINLILNANKFAKIAYKTFVDSISSQKNASEERLKSKWVTDIGQFIEGSVQRITRATESTYLLYLHFRIINRIYATNKFLYNAKIIEQNVCTFCQRDTESIPHLFWQCHEIQIFIKEVLSHLRIKYSTSINMNLVKYFLLVELSSIEILVATMIKSHIHKSRLKSNKPSVEALMQALKWEATKEHKIAQTKGNIDLFEQKWGELKQILTNLT